VQAGLAQTAAQRQPDNHLANHNKWQWDKDFMLNKKASHKKWKGVEVVHQAQRPCTEGAQ